MSTDRPRAPKRSGRQMAVGLAFLVILFIIIYQLWGLLRGPSTTTSTSTTPNVAMQEQMTPPIRTPKPAPLPKPTPPQMSPAELQVLQLQQQNEAKYLAALNELQMLKVNREIAETNQAIANAKLATINAEKNIVNILTPPAPVIYPPVNYSKTLTGTNRPGTTTTSTTAVTQTGNEEAVYTVIAVSQLQWKWRAVIGYQGNLYQVSAGDILPPDGSKVVSISASGVVLQKDGVRRRVSLVPII